MIYILLALALLAGLTVALSRSADVGGDNLDYEQNELLTSRTIAYAGSAKNVVDQMTMSGTSIDNLSYVRPNQTSFDTSPHHNKVYHPSGGGLTLAASDAGVFATGLTPQAGWYMGRFNNIAWTTTTAQDVIFTAYGISQAICQGINKKITGAITIPPLQGTGNPLTYFVDSTISSVANANLTNVECPQCEGYPSMCVSNGAGTIFAYYNIISAQ
jgi:hypothetical protein